MKRPLIYVFTNVLILSLLVSCKPTPPTPTSQDEYDYGFITRYGAYYAEQGIPSNVFMLDVYTPGLRLNDEGYIEGSGRNLCFSDVFTPSTATALQDGVVYTADSTGREDSFLPGQDFEGNINGAYLLDIKDNKVTAITLISNGTFVISHVADTMHIDFELVTDKKTVYKATYHARITYKNQQ